MHRLYHHQGERATAKAAEKMGTMFGISTMATTSIEEIGKLTKVQNYFNFIFIKTEVLTDNLIERCEKANFDSNVFNS